MTRKKVGKSIVALSLKSLNFKSSGKQENCGKLIIPLKRKFAAVFNFTDT